MQCLFRIRVQATTMNCKNRLKERAVHCRLSTRTARNNSSSMKYQHNELIIKCSRNAKRNYYLRTWRRCYSVSTLSGFFENNSVRELSYLHNLELYTKSCLKFQTEKDRKKASAAFVVARVKLEKKKYVETGDRWRQTFVSTHPYPRLSKITSSHNIGKKTTTRR